MFLKNQWYVAAWSKDVGREPLGRVLLNEYVVLYRKEDGTPVALENRCPHRNLPLSEGNLIGDIVQCAYHGLEFDCTGACVHVPGQSEVPEWAQVKAYPLAEQGGWLFIWMGDPALADLSAVPTYHRNLSDPDWKEVSGQTLVKAGYRLVLDNLLDLSHLAYVHSSSTGSRDVAESAELYTEVEDDRVRVTRWMADIPPAKAFVDFAGYENNMDRWQVSEFLPPSYINICNGSTDAGQGVPQAERPSTLGRWGFRVYHALTPETETTTHQFWAVLLPKEFVSDDMTGVYQKAMHNVLKEDLDVYEAQQRCIDLDPEARDGDANPKGTIPADEALLQMRRLIRRMYGEEAKGQQAA